MKSPEQRLEYHLDRTDVWAKRHDRFDSAFNPLHALTQTIRNRFSSEGLLSDMISLLLPMFLGAGFGLIMTQHPVTTVIFWMILAYFTVAFLLTIFCRWREAQNYAAIARIPREKTDDEALEARIACGIRYGHDYTQQRDTGQA
jgi:hypothetical protein